MALVVNLTRIRSPIISDCNRLCWTLGSQVRRVLCFENGTLFPYCFILPWNKPCWDRLNGWDTTSHNALLGNIGDGEKPMYVVGKLSICACLPLTPDFLPWSPARHQRAVKTYRSPCDTSIVWHDARCKTVPCWLLRTSMPSRRFSWFPLLALRKLKVKETK